MTFCVLVLFCYAEEVAGDILVFWYLRCVLANRRKFFHVVCVLFLITCTAL